MVLFLQIAFAIGLLVLLWHLVGGEDALALLVGAEPVWLLAAFLILSLQTVLSALRWKITASQLGISLSWKKALSEYYLAQILNQALPGGVVGDASRAVRSRNQAGLLVSGQSVIFERLAGQLGLFLLMTVAFLATFLAPGGLEWPGWLSIWIFGFIFLAVAIPILFVATARFSKGKFGKALTGFAGAAREALFARSVVGWQIALSIGTVLCNVAGFAFAAWAVGADLAFTSALALVPVILLAMLLPLSISGWGLREGVAVTLFPIAGLAATQGLAASVAFGLICIVVALPGMLFIGGLQSAGGPQSPGRFRTKAGSVGVSGE